MKVVWIVLVSIWLILAMLFLCLALWYLRGVNSIAKAKMQGEKHLNDIMRDLLDIE